MKPRSFKVPYAIGTGGRLIARRDAVKGEAYFCPNSTCHARLLVRKGTRQLHFSHAAAPACSLETAEHALAKLLVVDVVSRWREGSGPAPVLRRPCAACGATFSRSLEDVFVDRAEREVVVSSGHRVDVALLKEGAVRCAIEVRQTHAVEEAKASSLAVPFIEVRARAIIEEPSVWAALREGRLRPGVCADCRARRVAQAAGVAQVDEAADPVRASSVPKSTGLRTDPGGIVWMKCPSCGEEVPRYRWAEQVEIRRTTRGHYRSVAPSLTTFARCRSCKARLAPS